jgi:hypothetical protein
MTLPESFNPYQAPEVQEQNEIRLGEDSEFLISEREILRRETVKLPEICIHTAAANDLLERLATFRSPQIPVAAFLMLIPILAGRYAGALEMILLAVVGLFVPGLMRRFTKWTLPGVKTIDATWYVNRDYCRRSCRQQWIIQGIILVAAFAGGFAISYSMAPPGNPASMSDASLAALFSAVFFGGLSLFLRIERRLRYSGRRWRRPHSGLFSLTGHSNRFAKSVERIIHSGF